MKRLILFVMIILGLIVSPLLVNAEPSIVDQGSCGENLTWALDDKGTLTISGTGSMSDWQATKECQSELITAVVIEKGATSISPNAFSNCPNLNYVSIQYMWVYNGARIRSIPSGAFGFCENLHSVGLNIYIENIDDNAFEGCENLEIYTSYCDRYVKNWTETHGYTYDTTNTTHVNVVGDDAKEPTCTETGLTWGYHCTTCGTIFRAQEIIPAIGHKWNTPTYIWADDITQF